MTVFIYSNQSSQALIREGRTGLEDDLDHFLGPSGEVTGGGAGADGWNIDFELAETADGETTLARIVAFLQHWGVPPDTYLLIPANGDEAAPHRIQVFADRL